MISFSKMVNAVRGKSEVLTVKEFTVYVVKEERGVFLTQRRTVAVGTVRARSVQAAREEVARLFPDMSGAYPEPRIEND